MAKCSVIGWGDASFANMPNGNSQYGVVGMLVQPRATTPTDRPDAIKGFPAFWKSASCKRKVRATMGAEAYGISEVTERAEHLRLVLTEIFHPQLELRRLEAKAEVSKDIHIRTDSDSLNTTVSKESGTVQDKRLFIVIAALREAFRQMRRQYLTWVHTSEMVADPLTKRGANPEGA